MWYEERNQFVRAPVPKAFDRLVEKLQNSDSVLFESISLPSLSALAYHDCPAKTGRSQTALSNRRESIIDLSDDFLSDDEPETPSAKTADLQLRALLDRVHELEAQNKKKDEEISSLKRQLEPQNDKGRRVSEGDASGVADTLFYKTQYERIKIQYEKLKEALAGEAKLKRIALRSASSHKFSA
jgi:hypothetical protein